MQIVQLSFLDGKRCCACHHWKPLDDFHKEKAKRDGRSSECKECAGIRQRAYYAANKEQIKEQNRQRWHERGEQYRQSCHRWYQAHRETQLEVFRRYRKENSEKLRVMGQSYYRRNKARLNEVARQWRRNNPEHHRQLWHAYRARRKNAPGAHTLAEWRKLRRWFGNVCVCCGAHENLTVDHVVPLSKGGSNDVSNLQPLCHSCNCSKQDQDTDYRNPDRLAAFLASIGR